MSITDSLRRSRWGRRTSKNEGGGMFWGQDVFCDYVFLRRVFLYITCKWQ